MHWIYSSPPISTQNPISRHSHPSSHISHPSSAASRLGDLHHRRAWARGGHHPACHGSRRSLCPCCSRRPHSRRPRARTEASPSHHFVHLDLEAPPVAPSIELNPLWRPPTAAAGDARAAKIGTDNTTPLQQPSASRSELLLPGSVVSLYSSEPSLDQSLLHKTRSMSWYIWFSYREICCFLKNKTRSMLWYGKPDAGLCILLN
jgi:hypothetical protein